ncbi:lipoxygenase homology domain-containing protein 1-like [Orbicella faveolata]|uniref:lipoxygenase homology domain-containing protein 1-like n=1 Tax=Orbicella faveolata TaxID=48498 RepID=UPI0009E625F5|nr:lipoxygenase homology domain-containing protein 1-like [Orbicella faveolata]
MFVTHYCKWCSFIGLALLCFVPKTSSNESKWRNDEKDTKRGSTTALYYVSVTTADEQWAGTDADVFIQIFGKNGNTSAVELTKSGNLFERGDVDDFILVENAVGSLEKVGIKRNEKGVWDDWKLELVTVKPAGSLVHKFAFNEWIPANEWVYSYGG